MGSFCTNTVTELPDSSTVIEGTELPEWVSAGGKMLFEQAANIASSPYPEFTGPRIATYGNVLDEAGNPIQIGTNPNLS